ncbi:hypothetical protein F0562_023663 [Nyssa sinensis]|uniref:CCHC-type domain-containing protein n=1 Tax=Nyssa sinensis TaxID=561372 RepID=A0A5J5BN00_9ASTE|nr:hypothetical protein F0562_023663 [Nyssa sinensis]
MKLRPEYESVRSSLLNRSLVPSLDICFGELLREEQRLSTQALLEQSHGSSGMATVAYAAQGRGPPLNSKNLQCFCCKEYGHIAAHCPKKFCSYCKKKGHIITACRLCPQNRQAQVFQTSVIIPPVATSAAHGSPSDASSVPAPPATNYCTPEMVQQMLISALSAMGFQGNNSTKLCSRFKPGIVYTRRSRPQSLSVAHPISDPTTLQIQSVAAPPAPLVRRSPRVSVPPDRLDAMLLVLQVESVSDLETTGKTNGSYEKLILERVTSGPNSGICQNFGSVEAYDEITEKVNGSLEEQNEPSGSSSQKDNFHTEADVVSNLHTGKHAVPNGGLSGNASEINFKSAQIVFFHDLEEGNESKNKLETEVDRFLETRELKDGGFVEPIESDSSSSIQAESLRFEVSQYTGRIHLYSCIPGVDSRPRPLFENFQPEELESQNPPADNDKKMARKSIKDTPAYRHTLVAFINEWNNLRPIQQKKLLCKPLQLPLSIELCYLTESLNHDSGGLLKGGSKRRATPLHEISHSLPSNAEWKKVHLRSGYGKKEKEYTQGWTVMDEPLCKLCQAPCKGNNAKTPEFFEDLFCNLGCYEEYRSRTSNRSLREGLFQIEHGICTNCQLNCHKLVEHIRPLSDAKRLEYIMRVAPQVARHEKLLKKLVREPTEGNAWHADHIVPVYRGGGECRLENMRTLCVACHADVTATQRAERHSTRVKAKERLKILMGDLRNDQNVKETDFNPQAPSHLEMQENIVEDELFIKVPGSAYSGARNDVTGSEEYEKSSNSQSQVPNYPGSDEAS